MDGRTKIKSDKFINKKVTVIPGWQGDMLPGATVTFCHLHIRWLLSVGKENISSIIIMINRIHIMKY